MAKFSRWNDVKTSRLTPAQIDKIDREVTAELAEMDLRALRETLGITQVELAKRLETVQPEISSFEKRKDKKLSTLRRFVHALGGELEVIAAFGNRRVRLR